jgi:uncharacterized protein (DUF2237 family)
VYDFIINKLACSKMNDNDEKNVRGTDLQPCSQDPLTGFYRNGYCQTGPEDRGEHVVCAQVTQEFLEYSQEQGNDLMSARPEFGFNGLKPGDKWCLCAARWLEALEAGIAPPIDLEATHESLRTHIDREVLERYALDKS